MDKLTMSKFTFVLLVAAAAMSVQGAPFQSSELEAAAQSGNWDEFRRLLTQGVGFSNWPVPLTDDIKQLRGGPDTHVYGHSVSSFKSSSNINGQRSEFSAGHKITNNDGQIEEYDFKP